jgi:aldose 1-epimerase
VSALADYQGALGVPTPALDEVYGIQAGFLSARLWPQAGGRIASLRHAPPDRAPLEILVPLTPTPFDPDAWPKGGCYPLVPWSNRIRGAQFTFDQRVIRLRPHPDCLPHALHGFAQQRPWTLGDRTLTSAQTTYIHQPDEWPWAFTAVQTVRIAPTGLTIDLAVTNTSDREMPLGAGLHPFLAATAGDEIDFSAKAEWLADHDGIATHRLPLSVETVNQVHGPEGHTRYFSDWDAIAVLRRAGEGIVTITASASLDHFVFHTPPGGAYACLEPVSHVADAVNLAAQGVAHTGFLTLAAGQTFGASVHIGVSRSP